MKLKITAIVLGIFSLFYSVNSVCGMTELFLIDGRFDIKIISGNPIFIILWLLTLSTIGLFVASFGLYKGKRWGHILSNICLVLFLVDFAVILIKQFFPDFIDSTIQPKSGWFVFYHMNLNFETFAAPILAVIFVIILNLKFIRRGN